jgi:hypothetical protein
MAALPNAPPENPYIRRKGSTTTMVTDIAARQ